MDFAGKRVVVTGAANGIGKATARKLAQLGADVAVLDIEKDTLESTVQSIAELGRRAFPIALDLTNRSAIEAAFGRLKQEFGVIDVLVNNVGQTARERSSEFWCSEPEIWDFVLNVSLKSTLLCTRQVVGDMRERRGGRIVNVASDAAIMGEAGAVDYSAAKGGVLGFTRALARELGSFQVNVNAVCPGPTRTRGPERLGAAFMDKATESMVLKDWSEPEDIANGIAFLASDMARTITGQSLVINSGRVFY